MRNKRKSDGPRVFPVPTGLLALQGQDELGVFIRKNLKKLGVTTEFIKGESEVQRGQSYLGHLWWQPMICLFYLLFVAANSQFSTAQVSIVYVYNNSDLP